MVVVRGDARSESRLLCLVWMCCLAMIGIVSGELMLSHSFSAPFNDVQVDGKRFVSRDWSPAGETQVNQNFVRLTPDRQSKIGALWSHKALGVDAVTMTLKFRIHGQGKKFFGDGIGFWVMESPYWQEGDLHGVSHAFVGVGVAFDTFRNTEHGTRHRDVAVFVNNGDRSREEVLTGFDGCDASIRYHGERADFSVTNSSRAKLTIEGNTLSVQIDPRGQGNWFQCTTVDLSTYNLPEHWLRKAHVGLTGTTGQLADNHDVISLHTFNDLDVHPEADDLIVTPKFGRGVDLSVEERLDRVEVHTFFPLLIFFPPSHLLPLSHPSPSHPLFLARGALFHLPVQIHPLLIRSFSSFSFLPSLPSPLFSGHDVADPPPPGRDAGAQRASAGRHPGPYSQYH
ncbi:mannose-binding 2 [Nannochloropsis gaditana]|uniref:Mannose-binding 2 n=1 Tax=Nannochloropsis gaditana TaxID=72520 RepID=W7TMR6_9STRA|nr:mannose-binding 2 [Nannochloropsis gaditana]